MKASTLALFTVVLLIGRAPAWGDELASWYTTDPRAGGYASVRGDLRLIFSEGSSEQVPLWVLADKLREGASKRAAPNLLVSALRAELGRLERARTIVERTAARARGLDRREREGSMKAVVVFMRAGLSEPLIGELWDAGAAAPGGPQSAVSALEAVMELRAVARVADSDSLEIGKLLITGMTGRPAYASFAPVFARARTRGISDDSVVRQVIIPTLSSGGDAAAMIARIDSAPPPVPARAPRPAASSVPGPASAAPAAAEAQRTPPAPSVYSGHPTFGTAPASPGVPGAHPVPASQARPSAANQAPGRAQPAKVTGPGN